MPLTLSLRRLSRTFLKSIAKTWATVFTTCFQALKENHCIFLWCVHPPRLTLTYAAVNQKYVQWNSQCRNVRGFQRIERCISINELLIHRRKFLYNCQWRVILTLTPYSRQGRRFAWCSNGPTKTTVDFERSRCRRSVRRAAAVPWPVNNTASCSPAPTACLTMSLASCLQCYLSSGYIDSSFRGR